MISYSDFKKKAGWWGKFKTDNPNAANALVGAGIGTGIGALYHFLSGKSRSMLRRLLTGGLFGGVAGAAYSPVKNRLIDVWNKKKIKMSKNDVDTNVNDDTQAHTEDKIPSQPTSPNTINNLRKYIDTALERRELSDVPSVILNGNDKTRATHDSFTRRLLDLQQTVYSKNVDVNAASHAFGNLRRDMADFYAKNMPGITGNDVLQEKVKQNFLRRIGKLFPLTNEDSNENLPEIEFEPGELNKEQFEYKFLIPSLMASNDKSGHLGMT